MDMGMDTNMESYLMFSSLPVECMDRIVDDLDVLYCRWVAGSGCRYTTL
jgi:hypothetical protein